MIPDGDVMQLASIGFLEFSKTKPNGSVWIRENPHFFMAFHDATLYENKEFTSAIKRIVKSIQTLTYLTSFVSRADKLDKSISQHFLKRLESPEFNSKFKLFATRHLLTAHSFNWLDGAQSYDITSSKVSALDSILSKTFSTADITEELTSVKVLSISDELINNKYKSVSDYLSQNKIELF